MPTAPPSPRSLASAIQRFARLRASTPAEKGVQEFEAWINASLENREAMTAICEQWEDIDTLRSDTDILEIRDAVQREVKAIKGWRAARNAIAASLVVAVLTAAAFTPSLYRGHVERQARAHATVLRTDVGQLRTVRLADGSQATLDTDTELRFWQVKNGRKVELLRGRARFQVSKDPSRPFSVLAANKTVTAVGTDFDVYLQADGVRVNLVEGRLRVKDEGRGRTAPTVEMSAGYRLTATRTGFALAQADTAADTAWTHNELNFQNSTLDSIVSELNRYSARKIVVADRGVGQRRMTAMISSKDRQAFLAAVDALGLARVRSDGDGDALLPR